jgi:hypothetical protein
MRYSLMWRGEERVKPRRGGSSESGDLRKVWAGKKEDIF